MYRESEQQDPNLQWNGCLETVGLSRDRVAFMALYDHFAPRLNRWLLRLTGDTSLAEELVQETMLTVWRKACLYDSRKAAASTWLFRIARNLYLDHLRRVKVRGGDPVELTDPQPADDEWQLDARRIREALKTLPVVQAQVIYKSYFEGKSHQQIAAELELPLGSVKSSLRLAFQKLSKLMGPEE